MMRLGCACGGLVHTALRLHRCRSRLDAFGTTPRHDEAELTVSRGTTRVDSMADFSVMQREGVGGVVAPGGPASAGHGAPRLRVGIVTLMAPSAEFDFSAAFDSSESARTAWETLVSGGLLPASMSRPGSAGSFAVSTGVASRSCEASGVDMMLCAGPGKSGAGRDFEVMLGRMTSDGGTFVLIAEYW